MASYYILENNQQQGPFTIDQLAMRGLTPYTNVWTTGMANWVPASQVPELQQLFNRPQGFQAPPYQSGGGYQPQPAPSYGYNSGYGQQPQGGPCPKTWMVESILATLFCCLPFGIVGIINASKVSSAHAEGRFADAQRASQDAGKWTKIAFWLGLVGIILYILFYVFIFGAAFLANS